MLPSLCVSPAFAFCVLWAFLLECRLNCLFGVLGARTARHSCRVLFLYVSVFFVFLPAARSLFSGVCLCMQRVMGLMAGLDLNCSVSTLCFSPSGSSLLIGSLHCPKVFLYDIEAGTLTAAFLLTSNCLLEGIFRELNSKYIADDGMYKPSASCAYARNSTNRYPQHRQAPPTTRSSNACSVIQPEQLRG